MTPMEAEALGASMACLPGWRWQPRMLARFFGVEPPGHGHTGRTVVGVTAYGWPIVWDAPTGPRATSYVDPKLVWPDPRDPATRAALVSVLEERAGCALALLPPQAVEGGLWAVVPTDGTDGTDGAGWGAETAEAALFLAASELLATPADLPPAADDFDGLTWGDGNMETTP